MSDFNDKIISEFRANDGHVASNGFGDNLAILHTVGAKSGAERLAPLFALSENGTWKVIGSAAGSPKHPAWVHNLRAHPRIEIEVPGDGRIDTITVDVTEVPEDQWQTEWDKFTSASSGFADYTKTAQGRRFPIFVLSPA